MKQGGLLFPKEPARKKRKKHHKSIIDRDMKNQCFICGKTGYTERHHIYGSANRKYSEQYGLTVYLCPECHRTSEISAPETKKSGLPCSGSVREHLRKSVAAGINSRKYLGKTIWRMNR